LPTEYDDCTSNPCLNGATCHDGVVSYKCTCTGAYKGDNCENSKFIISRETTVKAVSLLFQGRQLWKQQVYYFKVDNCETASLLFQGRQLWKQ
jgi:hypothetical protein